MSAGGWQRRRGLVFIRADTSEQELSSTQQVAPPDYQTAIKEPLCSRHISAHISATFRDPDRHVTGTEQHFMHTRSTVEGWTPSGVNSHKDLQLTFSRWATLHVDGSLPEAKSEVEGGGAGEAEGVMGKEITSSCSKVFYKYSVEYTDRQAGITQMFWSSVASMTWTLSR